MSDNEDLKDLAGSGNETEKHDDSVEAASSSTDDSAEELNCVSCRISSKAKDPCLPKPGKRRHRVKWARTRNSKVKGSKRKTKVRPSGRWCRL